MNREAEKALELSGVDFIRRQSAIIEDLEEFRQLITKWQRIQNLVSRETLDQFWTRHIADSLQLLSYFPENPKTILDIGSGGGLPAIPVAIALKETETNFVLVESNSRKVAFLRAVARDLGLKMKIIDARVEEFVSRETEIPDIITARALAPLVDLLKYAHPVWAEKTIAFFHKGREHVEELAESHVRWHYDVVIRPSLIDRSGVVLEIANLRSKAG